MPAGRPPGGGKLRKPENAERVCELIAQGYTLRQVARQVGIESASCITKWAIQDEDFGKRYAQAQQVRWLSMAEEAVEIADDGTNDWIEREREGGGTFVAADHEHINRSKLRVDTRKWLLAKMLPRQFGDRVTTEVTGADGKDLIPEPDSQKLALALLSLLDRNGSRDDPEAPEPPAMVERERGG